jgi:3-hydroxybutyryl-CoA dehydrogenase
MAVKILVVGSGIMGNGIAQTFAQAGNQVVLNDLNMDILAAARKNIAIQLNLMAKNGLIDEQTVSAALDNIRLSDKLADCATDADMAFEAIPEKIELKENLFRQLEALCPPKTILATNTSGISINALAKGVKRKSRFIGTHFFMPAHLIPLVEVICGDETSAETAATIMEVLAAVGKKPVKVASDSPGFIANRLQHALAREAMSLVQKGVATPEGVDEVVKSSLAIRLLFTGPIEQRDFNGLDTHLSIASYLYKDLEDTHTPLKLLADKVAAGKLGLKTGEGFYDWRDKAKEQVLAKKNQDLIDVLKFLKNKE